MNTNFLNSLTNFLKKRTFEFVGLLLISLGIALTISFATYSPSDPSLVYGESSSNINNFFGIYGSRISDFLLQSFGLISFLVLITLISWGFRLIFKKELKNIIFKLFFLTLYLIFGCTFLHITFNNSFWLLDNGNSGFVGEAVYKYINQYTPIIENQYTSFALIALTILFFILSSDINLKKIFSKLFSFSINKKSESIENLNDELVTENTLNEEKKETQQSFFFAKEQTKTVENSKKFQLPSIDLLEKNNSKLSLQEMNKNRPDGKFMEGILQDFGISGQIQKINNGPVVSLYEFEPAAGVKVSKIVNLSDDLARNTSSTSARVAVIPGKNTVGIEIPNENREGVFLREIISNERFKSRDLKLPIALGKSISGVPIIGDLTSMPHLLIAGTTGSGKSVCVNTIITSLLYKLSPDLCKLILIDPKMLELSAYEGIPHLLSPVITDAKKATSALGWTVKEMNNRYKLMSKVGVRNIDGYNERHKLKMPYIVVVVDEMSDLMLVAGKEIENYIQKLSQMARAAGIHIIMATQRPSVDVITGTIKANFPTRISFQVTSKIDSRTILGEQGAEQLLGRGDMLYMAGGGKVTRVHGPFVEDSEVEKVTQFLSDQSVPDYDETITEEPENLNDENLYSLTSKNNNHKDELYEQAVALIARERRASTSFIQRHFKIGYNRAATIIEKMEENNVISKPGRAGKREVLIEDN